MVTRRVRNLSASLRQFRTARKVVVFESDDWGRDGIGSRQAYETLAAAGVIDSADPFNKCIRESTADLDGLYNVLGSFRDSNGRLPVITANFVMANPDFEAVEEGGYQRYSWIAIDDVVRRPRQAPLLRKLRQGVEGAVMWPQYHGRDHFNVETWLQAIRSEDPAARMAFRFRVALSRQSRYLESEYAENCCGALRLLPRSVIDAKVEDGIGIFRRLFGFVPLTSIAPSYIWCDDVEACLRQRGVRCMQAAGHRVRPSATGGAAPSQPTIFGGTSASGMIQLVRNCRFEPVQDGEAALGSCLGQIKQAFACGYPAIIDTHRVNYVGGVDPATRDANLHLLRRLLSYIVGEFHGVRFATSEELARSLHGGNGQWSAGVVQGDRLTPPAGLGRRLFWVMRERYLWWQARWH